jgi:hypothetical protein
MRATGGKAKSRSNSSRRICQMRPNTKPNASAAKGWAAIATLPELLQKSQHTPRILGLVCYVDGGFFVWCLITLDISAHHE